MTTENITRIEIVSRDGCRRNCIAYGNRVDGCPVCERKRTAFVAGVSNGLAMWGDGCTAEEIAKSDDPGCTSAASAILGCTGDFENAARMNGLTREGAWNLLDKVRSCALDRGTGITTTGRSNI